MQQRQNQDANTNTPVLMVAVRDTTSPFWSVTCKQKLSEAHFPHRSVPIPPIKMLTPVPRGGPDFLQPCESSFGRRRRHPVQTALLPLSPAGSTFSQRRKDHYFQARQVMVIMIKLSWDAADLLSTCGSMKQGSPISSTSYSMYSTSG